MSGSKFGTTSFHNDAIVISGVAGVFPKCNNVEEFAKKLYAKQDLITDMEEWPKALGLLNDIDRFDALFFGTRPEYVNCMDPSGRKLLEKSYEAILDAGINPTELRGKKVGVFVGVCNNDSECDVLQRLDNVGLSSAGILRCMLANRLSFYLDFKGPSLILDTGCSSSFHALHEARRAINNGECESAIVAACNTCRRSDTNYQYAQMGVLNLSTFRCRSFDHLAGGYVRSEAVCVIFLQKSSTARRVYAEVVNTRNNNNGFSDNGISYPSGKMQRQLVDEFYAECNVEKKLVSWIEAHGTGTKAGDPEELFCFEAFCQDRPDALYIGSVKSNMGHAEGASGLCSLIKVIIAMEHSAIPPNINIEFPNPQLKPIADGRIKIINETLPWEGGFVGIHSIGIGGSNSHVLLKSNQSVKRKTTKFCSNEESGCHRLVAVSGRTKDAVNDICEYVQSVSHDDEFIALIHGIFGTEIKQHMYRGYTLLGTNITDVEHTSGKKPPLWFIFSGMGSQWAPMAESLMKIPIFESSIQRCHDVLLAENYDLKSVLLNNDPSIYNRLLNCFVGITAMQIALADLLKAVDVIPDGIIGHSMGELAAAYCDGCLTLEECILNSYHRSIYTSEANLAEGLMFSVGLSYDELIKRCPREVDIACRNSPRNYVVSGPAEIMKQFESELIADGIFVKLIFTEQVSYHSRYIENAGWQLLDCLKKVIQNPKRRSDKWISSVTLKNDDFSDDVDGDLATFASAEYFVKNLTSCVNFEEAVSRIPPDAVTLEISAHGILTSVMKQFPDKYFQANLSTMNSNHPDNYDYLHTALGKLYNKGINMKLENLYTPIEFPVSKGTPMIAPLIRWDHSVKWPIPCMQKDKFYVTVDRCFNISLDAENYRFLKDHVVDGRDIFPGCGYLVLAWKAFASLYGKQINELSVSFREINFIRALSFQSADVVPLNMTIHRGSGLFEFSEGNECLCTGYIYRLSEHHKENDSLGKLYKEQLITVNVENQVLKTADIYKEINLCGLKYGPHFRNIVSCNLEGTEQIVKWNDNWITFLDVLLQCYVLQENTRVLMVPEYIERIIIDVEKHAELIKENANEIPVNVSSAKQLVVSPCVIIQNLKGAHILRRKYRKRAALQKSVFKPYAIHFETTPLTTALTLLMNVLYDNFVSWNIKLVEFFTEHDRKSGKSPVLSKLDESTHTFLYSMSAEIYTNDRKYTIDKADNDVSVHVVNNFPSNTNSLVTVVSYISNQKQMLEIAYDNTRENGFIILRERSTFRMPNTSNLQICCDYTVEDGDRILLLRKVTKNYRETEFFRIKSDKNFDWLTDLQDFVKINSDNRIVLLVEDEPTSGIIGFYKCLRKEVEGYNVRCIFVMDDPSVLPKCRRSFYEEQLRSDLAINVYKDGCWGCYQFLTLEDLNKISVPHSYLSIRTRGDFNTLAWLEGPLKARATENFIHIYYSSLNFKDILLASGLIVTPESALEDRGKTFLGGEYSGKLSNGKRVFGLVQNSSLATVLAIDENMQFLEVPEKWSLEDAATVTCVYATVLYALITKAELQKGESVLIHGGAGGVGLAAINVAMHYKCDIYTTVSSETKKLYLKQTFPTLEDTHIIVHTNSSIENVIMDQTEGKGINIILNSYSGSMREESVRCLTDYGRFIELGKVKITDKLTVFQYTRRQLSYHVVMIDEIIKDGAKFKKLLDMMKRGIEDGMIKPLKRTVFEMDEAEQAFRYMSTGHHVGKVLIRIRPEESEPHRKPQILMKESIPQFLCSDNGSVIVCGGLGGMGLELCYWLINGGIRNLVVTSRYGVKTGYQKLCLHRWKAMGVNVVISTADITTECGVEEMIRIASGLGPVLGIFNLTMVLRNGLFMNQTTENFRTAINSKATGTVLLDSISRRMCPYLRYFVVYSSVACGYGNTSQTNYGLANSVMERICEQRKRDGLHALAIEWGSVTDAGILEDLDENDNYQGTLPQPIRFCYSLLDYFLHQPNPTVVSFTVNEGIISEYSNNKVANVICNALGIKDLKIINPNTKLSELGLDSISTAEVKQMLEQNCNVYMTSKEIISLTVANIFVLDNV